MTGAHSTYAYREQQNKKLLKRLLEAEAVRWRARRKRLGSHPPSVATRTEVTFIDDELELIKQSLEWLQTATLPRRIR